MMRSRHSSGSALPLHLLNQPGGVQAGGGAQKLANFNSSSNSDISRAATFGSASECSTPFISPHGTPIPFNRSRHNSAQVWTLTQLFNKLKSFREGSPEERRLRSVSLNIASRLTVTRVVVHNRIAISPKSFDATYHRGRYHPFIFFVRCVVLKIQRNGTI